MISSKDCLSVNCKAILIQLKKEPIYFWFFCGYLFFEYVRPQTIYPVLDFIPWAKVCVILALLGRLGSTEPKPKSMLIGKYYWGLVASVLISSVFAEFPAMSFANINIVFIWLIIYYLFVLIVTTRFRFYIVVILIMLVSYKMSQHAAISWASRGFTFERWGISGGVGFFGNAADLGVQMLIILPLSLVLIKRCYKYWGNLKKIFFLFLPITALMAIIATGERNTLVGLAAICLVASLSSKKRMKSMISVSVFALVLIIIMPQEFVNRFDTAGTDRTSKTRLTYWKRGFEFFEQHPIFGIGHNNWVPYYLTHVPDDVEIYERRGEVAHSTPITVLAELGIIGFIFYYGIVIRAFRLNMISMKVYSSKLDEIWSYFPFALNLGLVGFLTTSIFLSITFYPFLFIQASLSAALNNILYTEVKTYNE